MSYEKHELIKKKKIWETWNMVIADAGERDDIKIFFFFIFIFLFE